MARRQIDFVDALTAPVFALAGAVTTGVASITIMDYDLSTAVISTSSQDISAAAIIAVLAVVFAYITNKPDFSRLGQQETALALGTIGLVALVPLVPAVNDFVTGSDVFGLVVLAVEAAGYYVLSWMG